MDAAARARLLRMTPFAGFGPRLPRVAELFTERRHPAGAVLFSEGDPGGPYMVLAHGRLRAYRTLPSGREMTLFVLEPGTSLCFVPLLDGGPYPISVAAMEESSTLVLEKTIFHTFLRTEPDLSIRLLENQAARLRACFDQLELMGQQGACERLAHALLGFVPSRGAEHEDATVTLPYSQVELARVLHVTPENLSRALAKMREYGLLERIGPRRFRIASVDGLRHVAAGEISASPLSRDKARSLAPV